jgi:hypothetical protein
MPRLFRRTRTSNQLRDQLLRQLENEGQKIIKQMASEFSSTLASESQRVIKDAIGSLRNGDAFSAQGAVNLLSSAVNYAVSRPRVSSSTRETERSQTAEQQFRLSRTQAAAEAAASLNQGNKNS